ncbi:chromosome partitioning protein [Cellulomonas sp. URHD0024]|uniref:MinD/ParA family ATP-binding protein n=1 Tax=Cellulomonas sp. URHD0024 TaxID=1302620 RepID=UPI00040736CF|nr:chromosome partitioning protein [Cellulomonas sp. URHD0024]
MSDDGQKGSTATRLPEISAEVREDGTGEISIDGVIERVTKANLAEAGAAITSRIAELAVSVGQPVPVQVRDPEGLWSLMIHPDGVVDEAQTDPVVAEQPNGAVAAPTVSERDSVAAVAGLPDDAVATPAAPATSSRGPAAKRADVPEPAPVVTPAAAPAPASPPATPTGPLPTLDDLLAARHPVEHGGPAEHGWQAGLRRMTFGAIKPGPGKVERRRRAASASVRRTLDGPKTIVVINPKGGAHKTTATMLMAATFGLQRGGYTLAWDNNETRGTLGWRSSHADHTRTAVDLLDALPRLTEQGTVRIGDLDGFVRTQPTEQFDVLASDENSASASSVDAKSFSDLHQVLSRFYRVILIDTGNNMRASNWRAAIGAADQIVVVSTIREDTAQSAAWALDALRSTGQEEAVRRAVTVLSAPEPKVDKDLHKRLRSHFGALTRTVVDVPHDKALVAGGPIDYEALAQRTRDAWLHVTATVADGL